MKKIYTDFIYLLPLFLLSLPLYPEHHLNGFPFDNLYEAFLVLLCLFLIINRKNFPLKNNIKNLIYVSSVILLCVQFLNTNSSYKGCYSTKETPVSNFDMAFNIEDKCQFSYQEPFDENITRHDYYLNFNQNPKNNESIEYTNWDLYFFNQTGFNFYDKNFYGGTNDLDIKAHWVQDGDDLRRVSYNTIKELQSKEFNYGFNSILFEMEPSRSWLSFGVSWTSDRKTSYEKAILIKYVGEAALEINKELIELPRSYLSENTYEILVPKNSEMTIHYFYRYNGFINSIPNIPYASFSVTDQANNPINIFEDNYDIYLKLLSFSIFLLVLGLYLFSYNKKSSNIALNLIAVIFGIYFVNTIPSSYVDIFEILLIIFSIYLISRRKIIKLKNHVSIVTLLAYSSIQNLNLSNQVLYVLGGSDPLKYESWSQQIIFQNSLQGGEDIYLYQPGYRYLLSVLRLFVGDSHASLSFFARFVFILLIFKIFFTLIEHNRDKLTFLNFNFLLTYIFLSTYSSKLNLFSSLSEWPTWIIGLLIIDLLIKNDINSKNLYQLSFLIGLCFIIRENQLPGLLFIMLITAFLQKNNKSLAGLFLIFPIFVLLPFLHNLFYGGEFVLEKNIFRSDVFYVSPIDLIFNFSQVYSDFLFQINFLFANPLNDGVRVMAGKIFPLSVAFILIQWVYIFLRSKKSLETILYFMIPIAFLSPHLFYQVHTYFPRHIIQGYLFMIGATLLIKVRQTNNIKLN